MNYNNIKLLFLLIIDEEIVHVLLINEDKYHYTLAFYNCKQFKYIVFTFNKITQELKLKKEDVLDTKKLLDIINGSKNIEEYKDVNNFDYKYIIITHIRKLKIENICQ